MESRISLLFLPSCLCFTEKNCDYNKSILIFFVRNIRCYLVGPRLAKATGPILFKLFKLLQNLYFRIEQMHEKVFLKVSNPKPRIFRLCSSALWVDQVFLSKLKDFILYYFLSILPFFYITCFLYYQSGLVHKP